MEEMETRGGRSQARLEDKVGGGGWWQKLGLVKVAVSG